jgi:hypothetical protein
MVRATWNGAVLAESDDTVAVEGNHYFPPDALNREYFAARDHHHSATAGRSPACAAGSRADCADARRAVRPRSAAPSSRAARDGRTVHLPRHAL